MIRSRYGCLEIKKVECYLYSTLRMPCIPLVFSSYGLQVSISELF